MIGNYRVAHVIPNFDDNNNFKKRYSYLPKSHHIYFNVWLFRQSNYVLFYVFGL